MKNEKGKNIIIALLMIIIILLIVVITLALTGKLTLNQNDQKTNNQDKHEETSSIKVEDDKDYVYDANYKSNNQYTEFNRPTPDNENSTQKIANYGIEVEYTIGMQYLSNLKVPYININTQDATKANKELESLYLEKAKTFDACAKEAIESPQDPSCSQILTYKTYQYNNILSIVVIESIQATSKWVLNYHIYNFDLTTGTLLSYDNLLSKLNYDKEQTLVKTENLLKNKMDELYNPIGDLSKACRETENNSLDYKEVSCYDKANKLLEKSIADNNVLCFVNNEGNLNILAVAYYDGVQDGTENKYLLEISK